MEKPPGPLREIVDNDDLETLENKHAVRINGFLFQAAKAARSECALCKLLFWSAYSTNQEDCLLNMPCVVILRPRYDWLRLDRRRGKLIHLYQVCVQFQPIENEILFDMTYVSRCRPIRKGRAMLPATFDIKLLSYWLQQCDKKHSHPVVPATLGTRMQSIISRGLFRVINTSTGSVETLTSPSSFVALSYVWGPATDESNYQPLESKPISAHAPTIRDAAVLASSLGFEWLWVDRVCIDQTNENEKAILIPYMKDIYAAAELTIAAACGDSAQSGLLGSAETPRKAERPLVLVSSVALLPVSLSLRSLLEKSVWGGRGWTFEEYVFSRRLLLVFDSEVLFTCGAYTFRESMGRNLMVVNEDEVERAIYGQGVPCHTSQLHTGLQGKPDNAAEVLNVNEFLRAVEEYTARNLTLQSDRVAAFAGVIIAAMKSPMDEVSEQALLTHGHPLRFFEVLLTWEQGTFRGEPSPLPDKPFVPSWSWAASAKGVYYCGIRNRLLYDRNCWFQFNILPDNNILALPTNDNSIARLTGLPLPDGLIADQPWANSPSDGLPLGYEARSSTGSPAHGSLALPKLHMVTLVFDARFVYWEWDKKHVLLPVGSTETTDGYEWRDGCEYMGFHGWSIHPELEPRYSPEEIGSRPQPFETFAIITGRTYSRPPNNRVWHDLYIMLLDPAGQHDTYTRAGFCRVDCVEGSHFAGVIKKGRPRWQYIRIA